MGSLSQLLEKSPRVITGVALALVAGTCLALGGWPFFGLVLLVAWAAAWEFMGLMQASKLCHFAALFFISICLLSVQLGHPEIALGIPVLLWWMGSLRFLVQHHEDVPYPFRHLPFFSLFYIAVPFSLALTWTPAQNALVLGGVIATDVGAYYAGSLLGGPKLWPAVTPKKTWAGSLGALVATTLVVVGAGQMWGAPLLGLDAGATVSIWAWLALAAVISIAAQLGDFFESILKRKAGVKDSGTLLPGHGGVLDRIDGLLAAAPATALFVFLWQML